MTEGGAGMRNADVGDNPSFRASALRRLGKSLHHRPDAANQTASIKNLLTRLS